MSSQPASGSGRTPSWRRLAGSTVVLFVVILAFLVGRVRAGADPGLARETTQAPQTQAPQTQAPSQVDPTDPFSDPQSGQGSDPGTGSDDNFGNAVPDGQDSQSADPPSTHVS